MNNIFFSFFPIFFALRLSKLFQEKTSAHPLTSSPARGCASQSLVNHLIATLVGKTEKEILPVSISIMPGRYFTAPTVIEHCDTELVGTVEVTKDDIVLGISGVQLPLELIDPNTIGPGGCVLHIGPAAFWRVKNALGHYRLNRLVGRPGAVHRLVSGIGGVIWIGDYCLPAIYLSLGKNHAVEKIGGVGFHVTGPRLGGVAVAAIGTAAGITMTSSVFGVEARTLEPFQFLVVDKTVEMMVESPGLPPVRRLRRRSGAWSLETVGKLQVVE